MSHIAKITPEYFTDIKKSLSKRWYALRSSKRFIEQVAKIHGISVKTVLQVKGSTDYADYQAQNKAQHPEVKYSARDDLMAYLKERCKEANIDYKEPSHMSIALYQLRQMDKVE